MKIKKYPQKTFLLIAHTYQPPRNFLRLAEDNNQEIRASILSGVNERIYQECYKPIFVDSPKIPQGMIFSLYGTLREWLKEYHPKEFILIKQKIQKLKQKEYYVLCDSYLHPILPLMTKEDQDMLIKIGKKAFEEDFGFTPKGFWLPELAVSSQTLALLLSNGFEYVVLRDEQIKHTRENPVYVDILENKQKIGEIAVIHFDRQISETVWFTNEATIRAEEFLQMFPQKPAYAIGTDTEVYGHLLSYKNEFLSYVVNKKTLSKYNFTHFDVKKALMRTKKSKAKIREFSSWSCPHGIKRWTGTCLCDTTDKKIIARIKALHELTQAYTNQINEKLDTYDPAWRESFIEFFLKTRKAVFENGNLEKEVKVLKNQKISILFKAKIAALIAQTSCFAFFRDSDDRPEREIAQINIKQIEMLLTDSPKTINMYMNAQYET